MLKSLKLRLFNYLMRSVFHLLTDDGAIDIKHVEQTQKKSKVYVSGIELSPGERQELIADAKAILRLGGFARILKALRADATDKLVNKSATIDDLVYHKATLYTLDVLDRLIRRLANLSQ